MDMHSTTVKCSGLCFYQLSYREGVFQLSARVKIPLFKPTQQCPLASSGITCVWPDSPAVMTCRIHAGASVPGPRTRQTTSGEVDKGDSSRFNRFDPLPCPTVSLRDEIASTLAALKIVQQTAQLISAATASPKPAFTAMSADPTSNPTAETVPDAAAEPSSSDAIQEKTDVLQFRDPNQPDLHLVFWTRRGYTEKPNPNIVLWVHGLGEHSGRHKALASELLSRVPALDGIACYDHRGHGKSAGARGAAPSVSALIDDFVHHASKRMALEFGPEAHIVVGGHSLGGLVVAGACGEPDWLEADACGKIVGVLLTSPAIDPCIEGRINKMLAPVSGFFAAIPGVKGMTKANGIDPKKLSHDEEAIKAYMDDEMVYV